MTHNALTETQAQANTELREGIRQLMAGWDVMQLERAGVTIQGITDSPLVKCIKMMDQRLNKDNA